MMSDVEGARHAHERGDLLRVLKEDYQEEMTSVKSLIRMLDLMGIPLSSDGIAFHLKYLEEQGYVRLLRERDMPNFRKDRRLPGSVRPDSIRFAKLLPKGLQLIDGRIQEDPSVAF